MSLITFGFPVKLYMSVKYWKPACNMFDKTEVVDIKPNIISESKMLITKINLQKKRCKWDFTEVFCLCEPMER